MDQANSTTVVGADWVSIHPNGRVAYVSSSVGQVQAFTINQTNGSLELLGSAQSVPAAARSVVSANGDFLDVASGGQIYGFSVADDGTLSRLPNSPFDGDAQLSILVSPNNRFLIYADGDCINSCGSRTLRIDSIAKDGQLVHASSLSIADSLGDVQRYLPDPSGRHLFYVDGSLIQTYTINPITGALQADPVSQGGFHPTPPGLTNLQGTCLFRVGSLDESDVEWYAVDDTSNPPLHYLGYSLGNWYTGDLQFDTSGQFLYTLDGGDSGPAITLMVADLNCNLSPVVHVVQTETATDHIISLQMIAFSPQP